MDLKALIRKYSTAGPRYTSYPTAPQWVESTGLESYRKHLTSAFSKADPPLALYVHVPFCESLCYYCGCNIQITKDHNRSGAYVQRLVEEMRSVSKALGKRRQLTQISWGGGTPTFLKAEEIQRLFAGTRECFDIAADAEVSIEIDPRVTTREQLKLLRELGFNRVSLGVQDFSEDVQKAVNRIQSLALTQSILEESRRLGFRGINFDLIYGLPLQTLDSFAKTIQSVITLHPDRIALYNYARLPGLLPHQKILEKFPMPEPDERVDIFTMAYDRLTHAGYRPIGMDHFAAADDELSVAADNGTLYRNFMGYTVKRGADLIGIGASAIGELGSAYFQNIKKAKEYEDSIDEQGIAAFRGCLLSPDDLRRKWVIQRLMCKFELRYGDFESEFGEGFEVYFAKELPLLATFFADDILRKNHEALLVTPLGRLFIRNVAMIFDAYLKMPSGPSGGASESPDRKSASPKYSQTV